MLQSTMLINVLFFGLGFFTILPESRALVTTSPPPDIRSLFTTAPGEKIDYPPLDVAGPQPRTKWVEAYQRAMKAGLIPTIPKSKIVNYQPVYPASFHGSICNPMMNQCTLPNVVVHAPSGMAGISFDDGPQPDSLELLDYLKSQSQKATHFLIGSRILSNRSIFRALDAAGEHLAGHTYSHPMMTSLTDLEIVGELGWVMQLIHDLSQKNFIIRYWRPPYGDVDQRVDAIASHVFGLKAILWQHDTNDWCLSDTVPNGSACSAGNGPQSLADLKKELSGFVNSPKQDGLIILEHEHNHRAIAGFRFAFPLMKKLNWITKTIPDLFNHAWYQ